MDYRKIHILVFPDMARYHDDDEMSCVAHDMLMTHMPDLARLAIHVCIWRGCCCMC